MLFLVRHKGEHYFNLGLIFYILGHVGYSYLFICDCLYPIKKEWSDVERVLINLFYIGGVTILLTYLYPKMGNYGKPIFFYGIIVFF